MYIAIFTSIKVNDLRTRIKEYKETEISRCQAPNIYSNEETFSLLYTKKDWIWFSKVHEMPKDFIRMFWEYGIDLKLYESRITFTINWENFDDKWYYKWFTRIKEFIDLLWTDYIGVSDGFHSVFDLETWEVIKYLN